MLPCHVGFHLHFCAKGYRAVGVHPVGVLVSQFSQLSQLCLGGRWWSLVVVGVLVALWWCVCSGAYVLVEFLWCLGGVVFEGMFFF